VVRFKRLELLKETLPSLSSVVVLWNGAASVGSRAFADAREAAPGMGMQVYSLDVRQPEVDLCEALRSAAADVARDLRRPGRRAVASSARLATHVPGSSGPSRR
jgi:hypothetical protein